MTAKRILAVGALVGLLATVSAVGQSVPTLINYQGRLTDHTPPQNPIDGTIQMEFRIYGSQTGSDLLWSEVWPGVEVIDGVFSVLLGSQGNPIPDSVFTAGTESFLETIVMGEVLEPRHRLASVPYSYVADRLDAFDSTDLEESAEIDGDIAAHNADPLAHANTAHIHDDRYYREDEIDQLIGWDTWHISTKAGTEELQFLHLNDLGVLAPVMTLQPPTGAGGRVGIGTASPTQKLEVGGAIKIGTTASGGDGTIRYTGTDLEGRIGGAWESLTSGEVLYFTANVKRFGALGDGETDDAAAVQGAIDSLAATGGVVFFPEGTYLVTSQLVLPNDGDPVTVRQRPIKFQGVGANYDVRPQLDKLPDDGSVLDLRYADGPKIVTLGSGLFEADGITFADRGVQLNDAPFIYTTNTILHVHDCAFYGRPPGTDPQNDAIILGGTDSGGVGGPDLNAPFQGYGTVIRDNFFSRIRRAVYGRVYANGVAFYGNTVWSSCGTDLPGGAAIEIDGDPEGTTNQVAAGWYVAGNLIEVSGYYYGIKTRESQRNAFIANNFFDASARTLAYYRFEDTGRLNYVLAGMHDDTKPFVDDQAPDGSKSTVVNFHQNQESIYAQGVRFLDELYLDSGAASPAGPKVVSPSGAELTYRFVGDNGMSVAYTPSGGPSVPLWEVTDEGGGVVVQELQGSDARIRNAGGAVRIRSEADSFVELGNVDGDGIRVEAGGIEFNSTTARILTGAGAPTDPAPNGSLYLRTDGGAGTTFYVREGDTWVPK